MTFVLSPDNCDLGILTFVFCPDNCYLGIVTFVLSQGNCGFDSFALPVEGSSSPGNCGLDSLIYIYIYIYIFKTFCLNPCKTISIFHSLCEESEVDVSMCRIF